MLEGQVAAISSGLLDVDRVSALVETMYESDLYRDDVDSFVLYPARRRPPFLERNQVPIEAIESSPLLAALVAARNDDIITCDIDGAHHFNADFKNAADLWAALESLTGTESSRWCHVTAPRRWICSNTSSTITRSPGARDDVRLRGHRQHLLAHGGQAAARGAGAPGGARSDERRGRRLLTGGYYRVRRGLGFEKDAEEYGAFPTDPYSHTPARGGARQPGMTGQVKEELLTRWAELGVTVSRGSIRFSPLLLSDAEFRNEPGSLACLDVDGRPREIEVPRAAAAPPSAEFRSSCIPSRRRPSP